MILVKDESPEVFALRKARDEAQRTAAAANHKYLDARAAFFKAQLADAGIVVGETPVTLFREVWSRLAGDYQVQPVEGVYFITRVGDYGDPTYSKAKKDGTPSKAPSGVWGVVGIEAAK
jgi:hypothetical protein